MTVNEWFKSRVKAVADSRESARRNGEGSSRAEIVARSGVPFPFQCSCGAKHQFEFTESPEGIRLSLK